MIQLTLVMCATLAAVIVTAAFVAARSKFPPDSHGARVGYIDGLRGVLATSVMLHHIAIWFDVARNEADWMPPPTPIVNQLGVGAVGLFFMITGCLFYRYVADASGWRRWLTMWANRLFRLLPMMGISILLVTVGVLLQIEWSGVALSDIFLYPAHVVVWLSGWYEPPLLGFPDTGRINAYVFWSLWYEWIFYFLILPVTAAIFRYTPAGQFRLQSLVLIAILTFGLSRFIAGESVKPTFITCLPLFFCGMIASELTSHPRIRTIFEGRYVHLIANLLFIGAISVFPSPLGWGMPAFMVFFLTICNGNSLFGILRRPFVMRLGDWSFGIYLLHGIALYFAYELGPKTLAQFNDIEAILISAIAGAIVVVTSAVLYHKVELPMISLGKRLTGRGTSPAHQPVYSSPISAP